MLNFSVYCWNIRCQQDSDCMRRGCHGSCIPGMRICNLGKYSEIPTQITTRQTIPSQTSIHMTQQQINSHTTTFKTAKPFRTPTHVTSRATTSLLRLPRRRPKHVTRLAKKSKTRLPCRTPKLTTSYATLSQTTSSVSPQETVALVTPHQTTSHSLLKTSMTPEHIASTTPALTYNTPLTTTKKQQTTTLSTQRRTGNMTSQENTTQSNTTHTKNCSDFLPTVALPSKFR